MSILELARPELLNRTGYQAALGQFDLIRLHANELPLMGEDNQDAARPIGGNFNRYPPPRPYELMNLISQQLSIGSQHLLITRGSNEAIDLLIRAFCCSGKDKIIISSPTFGMYEMCAQVQGATCINVPLDVEFDVDCDAIDAAVDEQVKIVFLCTPGNPTGRSLSKSKLDELGRRLAGRALLVLDQAYIEFATSESQLELVTRSDHIVILRTFSKAFGLAGLRCGMAIGSPEVIGLLDSLLAPYAIPTPTIDGVTRALSPAALQQTNSNVQVLRDEKRRLSNFLEELPDVDSIYRSDANFLLIKFKSADQVYQHLLDNGILVRRFDHDQRLRGCLRVTIGNPDENALLIGALKDMKS